MFVTKWNSVGSLANLRKKSAEAENVARSFDGRGRVCGAGRFTAFAAGCRS